MASQLCTQPDYVVCPHPYVCKNFQATCTLMQNDIESLGVTSFVCISIGFNIQTQCTVGEKKSTCEILQHSKLTITSNGVQTNMNDKEKLYIDIISNNVYTRMH